MALFPPHTYLDFHTHARSQPPASDVTEIVSEHFGKAPVADGYFTVGKHPWWTSEVLAGAERQALAARLQEPDCLAMGEMGLDKFQGPPLPQQMDILRSQLDLAQELGKPVVIHCVRAYDQLLRVKSEYPGIRRWVIHGYARHATLALQLVQQGFRLSLMPPGRLDDKYRQLLHALPVDRFFLETDSMPKIQLKDLYSQTAAVLAMPVETLRQQLLANAEEFFGA